MGMNKGKYVYKAKVYAAMYILIAMIIVDILFKTSMQRDKREQAIENIDHSVSCMQTWEDKSALTIEGIKACVKGMKTTPTGDMYILDYSTLEFVYDPSNDIPKNKKLYFTKKSIGQYFTEWKTAEKFIQGVKAGIDSTYSTKVKYNYDGSTEFLEYKSYFTKDKKRYVVVQGIQSDEYLRNFETLRTSIIIMVSAYVLWLIGSSFQKRRRDDDTRD